MFYRTFLADFLCRKFLFLKSNFLYSMDESRNGQYGISVTTYFSFYGFAYTSIISLLLYKLQNHQKWKICMHKVQNILIFLKIRQEIALCVI